MEGKKKKDTARLYGVDSHKAGNLCTGFDVSWLSLSEDIELPRTKCGLCNPLLFWELRDGQCND